jgi:hypothetical protein
MQQISNNDSWTGTSDFVSEAIMGWYSRKHGEEPWGLELLRTAMTEDCYDGVQFGPNARDQFNKTCGNRLVVDVCAEDEEDSGNDIFDKYCEIAASILECSSIEISDVLLRRRNTSKMVKPITPTSVENRSSVHTYTELWNVKKTHEMLIECADNAKISTVFKVVENPIISKCGEYYEVPVNYRYSVDRDCGRLYADGSSFQGCSGFMRRYLTCDGIAGREVVDIDMDNCFPVIFNQLMQRIGHEMKAVQYYINNREPALADVMRYYNVTRGVAKTLFLISLHGGDFKHHLTSEYNFNMDDYSPISLVKR